MLEECRRAPERLTPFARLGPKVEGVAAATADAHAAISDLCWLWEEVPAHPNLFFDTSWWNASDLIALFSPVPPGRILFGSDAPYMDPEAVFAITLRHERFGRPSVEPLTKSGRESSLTRRIYCLGPCHKKPIPLPRP